MIADATLNLPDVPGGWRERTIDLEWTTVDLALPATPDALLETEEVLEANRRDDSMPYWASLWPAAEQMARLLNGPEWPMGADVLEIGCGLGLVGIAGLKRGWNVHLTDGEPRAILAARYNAALNGFAEATVTLLDWRDPPTRQFPVILACDVLYEVRHHRPVLDLMHAMLSDSGHCWIGDPGRTPLAEFYHAAEDRGFHIEIRDCEGNACGFPKRSEFQILDVTKRW